jgi:hypothetical protein
MINSKHTMLTVYQKEISFLETGTLYQPPPSLNMCKATINMNLIIELPFNHRGIIIFSAGKPYEGICQE